MIIFVCAQKNAIHCISGHNKNMFFAAKPRGVYYLTIYDVLFLYNLVNLVAFRLINIKVRVRAG